MPKICELSFNEIQKIAAGQVVERPISVVKELVENSLDAGARQITISIVDGGKAVIQVTDDGCGMDAEDALLCFKKHATSKIKTVDQLSNISTFGFRGEALASIAAVAHVQMNTRLCDALEGTFVTIDAQACTQSQGACPAGTSITVKDLFYPVPARKKFLKAAHTEARSIIQFVQAMALVHCSVHFKLIIDGNLYINAPAVEASNDDALKNRCAHLFDERLVSLLTPMHFDRSDKTISVHGTVTNHQYGTYDRSQIFTFVNNRWIKNHKIVSALLKGYQGVLPAGKFPFGCCIITVDPTLVDINVHPRKEEVAFVHPRIVEQSVETAVTNALHHQITEHLTPSLNKIDLPFQPAQSTHWQHSEEYLKNHLLTGGHAADYTTISNTASIQSNVSHNRSEYASDLVITNKRVLPPSQPTATMHPSSFISPFTNIDYQNAASVVLLEQSNLVENRETPAKRAIIGNFGKTYILVEDENGLFMVDQHAAHERILYELFASRFGEIESITLLFAQIFQFSKEQIELIEQHIPLLTRHGIELQIFGSDQIMITAVPVYLKEVDLNDFLLKIAAWAKEFASIDADQLEKELTHKLRAQMACKAAVKAGDSLSTEQMEKLLRDLSDCPNNLTCPHGRPTGWLISCDEIERKFKRKN